MTRKAERERVKRSSSAAPKSGETLARRGLVRDALVALGSVAVVLRKRASRSVDQDELRRALAALREAFAASSAEVVGVQRAARAALAAFVDGRVASIEVALDDEKGTDLAVALEEASTPLDTAAGLLELLERSTEGAVVAVAAATLAEQALTLAWTIRSHGAIGVHVVPATLAEDYSVTCDPQVIARVLAIAVETVLGTARGTLRDEGTARTAPAVVVRTRLEGAVVVLEVASFTSADVGAVVMQTQLAVRIEPTDTVLRAATSSAGIELVIDRDRVLLRCPCTT